jgi:hypothetical protein
MNDLDRILDDHWKEAVARIERETGKRYLRVIPRGPVPEGRVVVHNQNPPRGPLNAGGFRAWLQSPDAERLERCDCVVLAPPAERG